MKNKNTYKQPFFLLLLILLGMSVLVFQTGHEYVQSTISANVGIEGSSNAENNDAQEIAVATQDVFLSVSTINVDQSYHQIKEIVFGDNKKQKHTHVISKYVSSFFKTLFQQVISPNAP